MKKSVIATLAIILGVALCWAAPPVDKLPSLLTTPAEARITSVIVGGSPPVTGASCTEVATSDMSSQTGWTDLNGDWTFNGTANPPGTTEAITIFQTDTTSANHYACITYTAWGDPANDWIGIILRSASNGAGAKYSVATGETSNAYFYTWNGSTAGTSEDSDSITISQGQRMCAAVSGTGTGTTIKVWDNPSVTSPDCPNQWGAATITLTTAGLDNTSDTASYVGLYSYWSVSQVQLDTFTMGTWTP